MHLYPELRGRRARAFVGDLMAIALLVVFGWAGVKVHGAVDRLAVLGEGVQASGNAVQGGFESAADAVDYTRDPLGDLASERYDALVAAALEDAGLRAKPAETART